MGVLINFNPQSQTVSSHSAPVMAEQMTHCCSAAIYRRGVQKKRNVGEKPHLFFLSFCPLSPSVSLSRFSFPQRYLLRSRRMVRETEPESERGSWRQKDTTRETHTQSYTQAECLIRHFVVSVSFYFQT